MLRFHEYRYAILNDPLIADFEYDILYKELEKLERENPELVSADSPTQRVANQLTKDFPTVEHLVPMLSLENSYNEDDLLDWDRKARELTGLEVLDYCIEPKFDGASISLTYENDRLLRAVLRAGMGLQAMRSRQISGRSDPFRWPPHFPAMVFSWSRSAGRC